MNNHKFATIHPPAIEKKSDSVRVTVKFTFDNQSQELYFEVPAAYEGALALDLGDAFIVGILPWAAANGYSLRSELPVSHDLLFQLRTFFLPFYSQLSNNALIELQAEAAPSTPTAPGVSAGLSCGIDSLATIYDFYLNATPQAPQITHLTFFDAGSHGYGPKAQELFEYRLANTRNCAKKLGLPLISVISNLHEVNKDIKEYGNIAYVCNISCAMLLAKLIGVFYLPSAFSIFEAYEWAQGGERDMGTYEAATIPMLSSSRLQLYLTGADSDRIEKTRKVTQIPASREFLNVCVQEAHNCGKCFKCIRTMITLDLLDALADYQQVFDIDSYRKNARTYWAKTRASVYQNIYSATLINAFPNRTASPSWLWYRFRNALKDIERFIRRKIRKKHS